MPNRNKHLMFDDILREKGVIGGTEGRVIHDRMDKNVKYFLKDHREIDWWHCEKGIREFVKNLSNSGFGIRQDKATDYIRIGLGHICLDYMASKLKDKNGGTYTGLDWDYVMKRTWNYYRKKGYHKCYFKYS